jgi:hypothetical protein
VTKAKLLLIAIALFAAIAIEPKVRAQMVCPQSARTIWLDAQRDAASGVQVLSDIRLCLDGVLISAGQAEIVGDEMVLRTATVTIPKDTLSTLSRGRRTVYRGDQLRDVPPQK